MVVFILFLNLFRNIFWKTAVQNEGSSILKADKSAKKSITVRASVSFRIYNIWYIFLKSLASRALTTYTNFDAFWVQSNNPFNSGIPGGLRPYGIKNVEILGSFHRVIRVLIELVMRLS